MTTVLAESEEIANDVSLKYIDSVSLSRKARGSFVQNIDDVILNMVE